MAFDFGMGKIGVAVGQFVTQSANPLTILKARDGIPDWDALGRLIKEWQPVKLVVGLPINMDGTPSEMSRLAEKFSRKLEGRYNVPAETMDERLTSFEAAAYVEQDEAVDAVAAVLILESWFKQQANSAD